MSHIYTSKKSSFIAGFLSIIPGLGQIYNEQTGKGLLMFLLFVGSFLFFVLRLTPFTVLPQLGMLPMELSPTIHTPMQTVWLSPWGMSGMSRVYPLLWFTVMLPFFVVFSIADAVQNARRINLGFAQAESMSSTPPPSPPPTGNSGNSSVGPEPAPSQPQQATTGNAYENTATGAFQTPMEEAMNTQNNTTQSNPAPEAPPQAPPQKRSRGVSGKFLLGIMLMAIGGIYILDELHMHVFTWATWEHLWPLIPLFFGLRLLREYQMDRDRGQFVLGSGFTAVGVIFLLENWNIFPAREFLEDFWMFLLFGVGALFVLIDLIERRYRK